MGFTRRGEFLSSLKWSCQRADEWKVLTEELSDDSDDCEAVAESPPTKEERNDPIAVFVLNVGVVLVCC